MSRNWLLGSEIAVEAAHHVFQEELRSMVPLQDAEVVLRWCEARRGSAWEYTV